MARSGGDTDVVVEVGVVEPDDFGALFKDDSDGLAIFTDYIVSVRHEKDYHRYLMGVTNPDGYKGKSASMVQLALPTIVKIVDWTACRSNRQPLIPKPESLDSDWVLMDEHAEPAMIRVLGDGETPLYRISGTYVYGYVGLDTDLSAKLVYPLPPWLQDVFDRTQPANNYQSSMIDSGASIGRTYKRTT